MIPFDFGVQENAIGKNGVVVEVDGSIRLYGNVKKIFRLEVEFIMTKFKRMELFYTQVSQVKQTDIGSICMYEELNTGTIVDENCSPVCYTPEEGQNSINIGKMFQDRLTSVKFISFTQNDGISEVRDLNFLSDPEVGIVDEDDECVDPNARRVRSLGPTGCTCLDGYEPSTGGALQGIFDTCISCLPNSDKGRCTSSLQNIYDMMVPNDCGSVSTRMGKFSLPLSIFLRI